MKHRGSVIEYVVRSSGISLSGLATRIGISRNTLYNRFKEKNLSYDFILNLGTILHYNFTVHFPEMQTDTVLLDDASAEIFDIEIKSKILLKKYNCLLVFLLKKSQDAHMPALHNKVKELIKFFSF